VYKCTTAGLFAWATRSDARQMDAQAGHQTKRDFLDAVARVCAAKARAAASSGPFGGVPKVDRLSVLDRLQAALRASF